MRHERKDTAVGRLNTSYAVRATIRIQWIEFGGLSMRIKIANRKQTPQLQRLALVFVSEIGSAFPVCNGNRQFGPSHIPEEHRRAGDLSVYNLHHGYTSFKSFASIQLEVRPILRTR